MHSYALAFLQVAEMFLHRLNGSFTCPETIRLSVTVARGAPALDAAAMERPYLNDINLCHVFPFHDHGLPHAI